MGDYQIIQIFRGKMSFCFPNMMQMLWARFFRAITTSKVSDKQFKKKSLTNYSQFFLGGCKTLCPSDAPSMNENVFFYTLYIVGGLSWITWLQKTQPISSQKDPVKATAVQRRRTSPKVPTETQTMRSCLMWPTLQRHRLLGRLPGTH